MLLLFCLLPFLFFISPPIRYIAVGAVLPPPLPYPSILALWAEEKEAKTMANCETCKKVQNSPGNVPYIVHESSMARMERQIKRLWIAVIIAVCMLFASNAAWLFCWMQYDYSSGTEEYIYQQDGKGTNIIGDSNEVNNVTESYYPEEETNTNP